METTLGLAFDTFPLNRPGIALLVFRVFVGIAFILHGSDKLKDVAAFAAHYHLSSWIARAAALTQVIGGALLVVGFLTPVAALGIAVTMAVATLLLIQKGEPYIDPRGHSWEGAAFYLMAGIVLALLGPGGYSIDARVFG